MSKEKEKAMVHAGRTAEVIGRMHSQMKDRVTAYLNNEYPASFFGEIDTVLELIYFAYTETNPVENERVRRNYSKLNERLIVLTGSEEGADILMNYVSDACSEYERVAYMEGIRVGARLMLELLNDK